MLSSVAVAIRISSAQAEVNQVVFGLSERHGQAAVLVSKNVSGFTVLLPLHILLFAGIRFDRGNVRPTFRVALYSLLSNLLIVSLLPQQFKLDIVGIAHNSNARDLFQFLFVSMSLARSVACVFILALYWWRRHHIIALITDFQRLVRVRVSHFPHSIMSVRRFRSALLRKILFISATDFLRFLMAWYSGKWRDQQTIILMIIFFALLSQVVNHFFFGMCILNLYLEALNKELQRIVDAVALLGAQRRLWRSNFPRRHARLINKFNALMATRQKLLRFADRLTKVLGAQAGCVIFVLYLYNVSLVYLLYSLTKPREAALLGMPPWAIACFLIVTAVYCADSLEVLFAFQRLQKNFSRCIPIMETLSELWQLNRYWERSVEQFFLQEACHYYQPMIVGLFPLGSQTLLW